MDSTKRAASTKSRGLMIALWTAQVLLAGAFGMAGFMKLASPIDVLAANMVWPGAIPPWLVRFIGFSEAAGALGILLPSLLRIQPWLTPLAGVGLATVQLLAAVFHISRGEAPVIGFNLILGGLAAFVAWGRWKRGNQHKKTEKS